MGLRKRKHRGDVRRLVISLHGRTWLEIKGEAFLRGVTEQELMRAVILPEWLMNHPEELALNRASSVDVPSAEAAMGTIPDMSSPARAQPDTVINEHEDQEG